MAGRIDSFRGENRFLSNFWVERNGKSNEHYFQAAKTTDKEARRLIFNADTPGQAKKMAAKKGFEKLSVQLGRQLELREDWNDIRLEVMLWGLRRKFEDPELADKLLATGDAELIEGNEWGDLFWGVCGGEGENHLGRLLMQVRDEIRRAHTSPVGDGNHQRARLSPLAERLEQFD